jgi:hypothetical protein
MKKEEIKFKRGVYTIHIPFMPKIGAYGELYEQIKKTKYPKNTRRIEATLTVAIDLEEGKISYEMAQVSISK